MLTQPLQLEQESALQLSTTTSLRGENSLCIPLFQSIHIQEMLVVHWQTLTNNMALNTPLLHFQTVKT